MTKDAQDNAFSDEDDPIAQLADRASKRQERSDFAGAAESWATLIEDLKKRFGSKLKMEKQPVPNLFSNLAYCLQSLGRHEEAVKNFEQALALEPLPHRWRGICFSYSELKRWKDMQRCALEATRLLPEDDYAWQQLGYAHVELGDLKAAEKAYSKAIKINPKNAHATMNLATLLWKLGKSGYLELFDRAYDLAPAFRELPAEPSEAALYADPAFVALLKKKRASVEVPDAAAPFGEWLVRAALHGDFDSAKRAFDAGASLDYHSASGGRTALNAAATGASPELVHYFLERGAAVDARDKSGETGFFNLVRKHYGDEDIKLANYMLENGADINAANDDGWTALLYVNRYDARWDKMIEWLLAHGADVNHASKDGWTPLILATHARRDIRHLLQSNHVDVNQRGAEFGWTPLMFAARKGQDNVVASLLERGADPNLKMKIGKGKPFAPKGVLAGNLRTEIRVPQKFDGYTALMWAVSKNRTPIVKSLLAAGADRNAKSTDGETALSLAKSKPLKALLES